MPRKPTLPEGVTLYRDHNGAGEIWRVRLGVKFLGKGCAPIKKAFPRYQEAVDWIREEEKRLHPHQAEATETGLSPAQVAEVRVALAKLAGRATLIDTVDFWVRHAAPVADSPTVKAAIELLHAEQEKQGLSERHVRETKTKLTRLFRGLETRKISEITARDIEKARDENDATGSKPSPSQRVKRIRYASILIAWAIEKGWIQEERSPLRGVSKPRLKAGKVEILTVKDTARLLQAAQEHLPGIVPALAIKIFSGVRNAELYLLTWAAIKAETIRVEKTKTDRARSVSILPPLPAWLPKEKPEGLIFSWKPTVKDREAVWLEAMEILREKSGVELPQNVLRHTFGSYHYATERDAAKTAFEMGNSPAIVQRHYADAVDTGEARQFWGLTPTIVDKFVNSKPRKHQPYQPPPISVKRQIALLD